MSISKTREAYAIASPGYSFFHKGPSLLEKVVACIKKMVTEE